MCMPYKAYHTLAIDLVYQYGKCHAVKLPNWLTFWFGYSSYTDASVIKTI